MKIEIYQPREDSFLLRDQVLKYAKGKCLDMGTGSGIQAIAASSRARSVLAVDIDEYALWFAENQAKALSVKNIKFKKSNLFSTVKGPFDTITFNPPYLPELKGEPKRLARQLSGGKKGYEILEKFFSEVDNHLAENGKILIVFSSLTNKEKVDEIIDSFGFEHNQISSQKIPDEILYVYLIERSDTLKKLKTKGLNKIEKFAKGHRGQIFTGILKNKVIAVKAPLKTSRAMGNIDREANWLRKLNKHNIGPKLIFKDKDMFGYEFVDGFLIRDVLPKTTKPKIKAILKEVFNQCFTLDSLKINKEEMHHPVKHVIVGKKIVLLDFERASNTIKPHNVTQFCQYVINQRKTLNNKGFKIDKEKIIKAAKHYKDNISKKTFNDVLRAVGV